MSKRDNDRIDPELESDLGAEFDLRGDQLQKELEAAREDAAHHLETAQRVQADFENFRKRNQREMEEIRKRAGQRIVEELLPVLDNLERAIDHTVAGGDLAHLLKGVEMVYQQINDVFGKEGVEVLDPFGQVFDPNIHQAVGQREDAEVPEGTVVDVFQKGYSLGGRVVRPAMVVVSTGGPAPEE
jgi:molecular chaperone GrpE